MSDGRLVRLPRGALAHLRRSDEGLAQLMATVGRCRLRVGFAETHLASLVRAIVYQQLSGKAAATIFGRFRALYPEDAFPTAQQIRRTHYTKLRKAGLSRQKQMALRDLCRHVVEGRLPLHDVEELEDEALIERLTAVRGIGRWSAQMFAIFQLGRLDHWPVDDLAVKKGAALVQGLDAMPTRKEMEAWGERFRPYRTVTAWYLWRSQDIQTPG
ncbi:MAG: DNA-3-methyladenine glycosylase 2 family protein [Deltaproteobacteria bacterium]|nr:DNA-3-methyladenine glycosylase 2 family protein [Deltaproteobacteria bacterium]